MVFIFELKIIIRNILRNKFFSAINLLGLSLGLAAAILIMLWVWDELSFDRFHDNADNIFLLINKNSDDQGNSMDFVESPAQMADYLVNNIPEIKKAVRIEYFYKGGLIQKENEFFNEKGASADISFFEIFTIPFVQGNKNNVFENPESIVISENMANRYYGEKNPIGEILKIKGYGDIYKTVTVTGVYKNFPGNSSINLDFIIPFSVEEKSYLDNWVVFSYATFILLDKNSDYNQINEKISSIYKDVANDGHYTSYLLPLVNLHLYSSLPFFNNESQGNVRLISILVFIAILILLIACINYMNLITARSVKKVKEVSIKRILGISRKKILVGFLTEAILFSLISFQLAIILVEVIRPYFNNITGKNISINYFEPQLLIGAIIIIVLLGLISAIYPYLYITSKNSVSHLKGKINHDNRGNFARKFLVIIQFIISIILIIFTSIILKQVNYIYSKDLGFDKENIIILNLSDLGNKVPIFKTKLLKTTNIISVTNGRLPLRSGGGWPDIWSWEGKESESRLAVNRINSDADYLNTIDIKLKKGRFFSEEYNDSASIVINEKFAELIGVEDILRKKIYFREKPYQIIGITDNFYSNYFSEIQATAFFNVSTNLTLIKVKNDKLEETIDYIKSEFRKMVADRPFKYTTIKHRFRFTRICALC
ncbi:MAG: FtsX-like permease family protein [Bacteroidales bacterium]|nr:FtsX-like permease family protein [Bacteroidales bacterium]